VVQLSVSRYFGIFAKLFITKGECFGPRRAIPSGRDSVSVAQKRCGELRTVSRGQKMNRTHMGWAGLIPSLQLTLLLLLA
jgi:hypothetical protein